MATPLTKWIYFFGHGFADAGQELRHIVGGKGASLGAMTRAQLNVPPGFTISAECCDLYTKNGRRWPDGLEVQVRAYLSRLEALASRRFGRGDNPLLVAVRSGAAQSMPGMMDTILNVGLNPACVNAVGQRTRNEAGAWQAYLHFQLMFARTATNIAEADLERIVSDFIRKVGKVNEDDLDAIQMRSLCLEVAKAYGTHVGQPFPTDPWAMLCAAINTVFDSWMSDRAVAYRKHHKIEGLGTAVNIQMMCPSEISGVMFTGNPVDPRSEQMMIESAYGLGEAVVLGKVTPDRFVVDKKSFAIVEREIARKEKRIAALAHDPRSGRADAASLTDEQVQELARLGLRVEEYFKHPCDLEWAFSQGQFFLLQARPIRYKAAALIDPAERERLRQSEIARLRSMSAPGGTVWARFNLSEILPEATPLTWSIVKQFMSARGGFGQMYRDLGYDPDPALAEECAFDLIAGRVYCNLSREPRMQYGIIPFEHCFAKLKADPAKAIYPTAEFNPRQASLGFWMKFPWYSLKQWWGESKRQGELRSFADRFERKVVPEFLRDVEAAAKEDWEALSEVDLFQKYMDWDFRTLTEFARESLKPTALAALLMAKIESAFARRYQPPGTKLQSGQPTGQERARLAMQELTMGVRPPPDADFALAIEKLAAGEMSRDAFLQLHGHRGHNEMELAQPRWQEDADAVDALAAKRTSGGTSTPSSTPSSPPGTPGGEGRGEGGQSPAQNIEFSAGSAPFTPDPSPPEYRGRGETGAAISPTFADVWPRIAKELRLAPFQIPFVERQLRSLHRLLGLREAGKHYLLRGYYLVRRALCLLDRRYKLDGGIFHLDLDELRNLVRLSPADPEMEEYKSRIAERRRQREALLSLPIPQVLFSDDLEAIGRDIEVAATDILKGTPLSAGQGEALAWVVTDVVGAAPNAEPYILVCPSTDPAWVPLFAQAKGLVMETGGVLSHGAIVAREFGLPAVAGIPDVHRRLRTGQRLFIDGGAGVVKVIG
jgi:phosphohistidine swiveling domain-containing protein